MTHNVLLGDPKYFRILYGLNPHTRNRWGFRKKVNLNKAIRQWSQFRDTLTSLGATIYCIPPNPDHPSLVFSANAGFIYPKHKKMSFNKKTFYLSNLSKHRQDEKAIYGQTLIRLGVSQKTVPYQFEGEADFFPCGNFYIFSHGDLVETGFKPCLDFPPYRFQFSHRSDVRNLDALKKIVAEDVVSVKLIDTRYYHGDTAMFACGIKREYLFVYLNAIDEESQNVLRKRLGNRLIPLSRHDAENFVANSFQLETPHGPHILIPTGTSTQVTSKIESFKLPYTEVDVSEFYKKGGGSIKCLIGDLGLTDA